LKYSVDTSALLDGWVRYYPPDIFTNLWKGLEALVHDGELQASEEVREELNRKDDDVAEWGRAPRGFFRSA
jgi:hypothetical protein